MKRGEVWWAQLPAPIGRRPVLLLSRDSMPPGRSEITVAYLTTTIRNTTVEVLVSRADGMPQDSVVNLDSINTIPKHALAAQPDLYPVGGEDGRGEGGHHRGSRFAVMALEWPGSPSSWTGCQKD